MKNMDMMLIYKKKGVSTVIVTVILVALAISIIAIVWVVMNNLTKSQMEQSQSCFGNFGKVTLNRLYVCYNNTGTYFSISLGEVDLDKVLVSVSSSGETKPFEITNTPTAIANLASYASSGFGTDLISLPSKNGGKSYITNYVIGKPDSITIAPVINGNTCQTSDELYDIELC